MLNILRKAEPSIQYILKVGYSGTLSFGRNPFQELGLKSKQPNVEAIFLIRNN